MTDSNKSQFRFKHDGTRYKLRTIGGEDTVWFALTDIAYLQRISENKIISSCQLIKWIKVDRYSKHYIIIDGINYCSYETLLFLLYRKQSCLSSDRLIFRLLRKLGVNKINKTLSSQITVPGVSNKFQRIEMPELNDYKNWKEIAIISYDSDLILAKNIGQKLYIEYKRHYATNTIRKRKDPFSNIQLNSYPPVRHPLLFQFLESSLG